MSSFPGRMKEYPTISVDRFDRENLHAKAYFLSHCHKDHMKGLKGPLLKRKLKFSLTVKLYCSFVTKELLLSNPKYGFWENRIVALELDSPTHISLTDEVTGEVEDVVVTLLPAGHCPGSVMFLFEGAQGTVLYTGDFRLAAGDAARMEHLHSGNRVKDIQSVYLDSTFYDPRFYQIPSRDLKWHAKLPQPPQEVQPLLCLLNQLGGVECPCEVLTDVDPQEACLTGIRKLVQDWIYQSPYHVIWLNCKAAYGYEYLFTNLGQEFNSQDYELFRTNRLPCGSLAPDGTPLRIISIKPSTMWFGERTRKTNVIVKMGASSYRACFSFHSSYSEIKDFLSYINPVHIYPNVVPLGRTVADVCELLNLMCRKQSEGAEVVYKPLGKLKRARIKSTSQGSDTDDELFGDVAVTPMRKKLAVNLEKERHSPEKTDLKDTETQILPQLQPSLQTSNYMDCTESNDDDDDDDDGGDEGDAEKEELPGDATPTPSCLAMSPPPTKLAPLSWSLFFTAEPVVTDDSCELENSQSSQTLSTDHTTSQSPELFIDDDESESGHVTSSQSTYVSEAALESLSQLDTEPVQRNSVHTGNDGQPDLTESHQDRCHVTDHTEPASDSQVSSDFDLPLTPGSKAPQPEELKELYKKLAAGDDVTSKNHQQGSV
ncbi:hypothetical protein QTP86_017660 [Hemibagrus guttatus]|nr:hypothetical protein QTP86_017660 [Hemibagrus guttatus]